jgi:proline iminopeptidase
VVPGAARPGQPHEAAHGCQRRPATTERLWAALVHRAELVVRAAPVLYPVGASAVSGGGSGEPRSVRTESEGASLSVRIAGSPGSGNVLIAVSGGPGLSSSYMLGLERLASTRFAVVTYDQRGTGRSTQPPLEPANYTLVRHAEDLDSVATSVGAQQVHLFGHSFGGLVVMQYAMLQPDRVQALILMGSGPPTWQGVLDAQLRLRSRVEQLQHEGTIPTELPADAEGQLQAVLPAYFSDPAYSFSPEDGAALQLNEHVSQVAFQAMQGYDLRPGLAALGHKVLILVGADDPFGRPMAEAVRDALPKARAEFAVLERCGHFWHERPDAFFERVGQFLEAPT